MARPEFEPTTEERQKVYQLTAAGFTVEDIAKVIWRYGKPISDKTVRKYFKKELDTARIEAVGAVAAKLFKTAMDGNVTAQIFYLKTRGGWKETTVNEHSGEIVSKNVELSKAEFAEIARDLLREV